MTRHGKNCTAGAVYTYHERQKASKVSGWGSLKARLGKDAMKEFDCCSLTLQPCRDPVVTKNGHLYDREAILEYILHHKQAIARKMKAYEKQLKKDGEASEIETQSVNKKKVDKFLGLEKSISTKRDNPFSSNDEAGPSAKKNKTESIENTNDKEKKNLPSFWIPTLTPQATASRVDKPDSNVYCPMSTKPIKMKDLIKVKFTLAPAEEGKSLIAQKERYVCAITRDVLSNTTPCAVLKPTGDVITMDYVEKFIKKDWMCPLTGKKLSEKDIIELKQGGTGFSAANGMVAKQYGPALTCG